MIEKMKIVHVVTCDTQKDALVDELRTLGIVHFAEKAAADRAWTDRFASLTRMSMALLDYAPKQQEETLLSDEAFEDLYKAVDDSMERKKELSTARSLALTGADKIRQWGNFRPDDVRALQKQGIDLHFYRMDKKVFAALTADETVQFISLAPVDKMNTVAVLGKLPASYAAGEFPLPEKSLEDLEQEVASCDQGMAECDAVLKDASKHLPSFRDQMLKAQNDAEYSSIRNTSSAGEGLVWLSGYIPAAEVDRFKAAAEQNRWAWAMDDPAEDDEKIPTKVKYNKVTRLMIPIFDILGTVPGYREYDISFWFLGFFTLFFAMIIGDAGYGCLFMLGAIALTVKNKKLDNMTTLLWVLSVATIVWGALTGTWFGLEGAMQVPLLKGLVIPSFANYPAYFDVSTTQQQNSIMKFCFIIGTVQLSLACVMNIRKKLGQKDLSWLSDLGWLAAICALYFVVLYLVIGQQVNLAPVAAVVICGFLMVVLFGGMAPDKTFAQGLKSGVGNAFTVFLNTISAFGNIMSYIRLFAVGMASLAIAQSFNNMASGFSGPLVIVGIFIMVIGHSLNVVMGLLSVVVHGVRLNLLEFSGQLGMEWTGIAYNPFKKLDKIKK